MTCFLVLLIIGEYSWTPVSFNLFTCIQSEQLNLEETGIDTKVCSIISLIMLHDHSTIVHIHPLSRIAVFVFSYVNIGESYDKINDWYSVVFVPFF